MKYIKTVTLLSVIVALQFVVTAPTAWAQQAHVDSVASAAAVETKPVTWDNFVRAETDKMFNSYVQLGGIGNFYHIRKPTPIDAQKIMRMNRDTLYSLLIVDLTSPVTITKPDTGDRFQSMQVINEDEYSVMVVYKPGKYTLTQEQVGTRYAIIGLRTFVKASDPADIKKVNAIQDQIQVEQASKGKFEIPNWDKKSQDRVRAALQVLASTMTDTSKAFGTKEDTDSYAHAIGCAWGWGANPVKDAKYLNFYPAMNDGKTPYTLTVKDVPVDGFWSVSLYNGKGYYVQNKYNAYALNNVTAKKSADVKLHHPFRQRSQATQLPADHGRLELHRPALSTAQGNS